MQKATDVFDEWAKNGKDIGMEEGHALSVDEMLNFALNERASINKNFSFLDIGCGNGWVTRKVSNNSLCLNAIGIDGAKQMIENAKSRGGSEDYFCSNIDEYNPEIKFDLIHSMEVMYYLSNPGDIIQKISDLWLKDNGRLIIGIDLYYENIDSHSWQAKVVTPMLMLKELEWVQLLNKAGLKEVQSWRANQSDEWAGTLVLTGKK